jgi:hypothetical protein
MHLTESATIPAPQPKNTIAAAQPERVAAPNPASRQRIARPRVRARRRKDTPARLMPQRPSDYLDRRGTSLLRGTTPDRERRRTNERRGGGYNIPFPDRRLTRSAYEQVFLQLVSGRKLRMGSELYKPIGMKGWYHAIFRRESDGAERLMTIDQLLRKMNDWQ